MGTSLRDHVAVSTACLNLGEIATMVSDPRAGATSTFSGTTRDNHHGKKVVRLEYEGYVPMAELELKKICAQVRTRWDVLRIAIVHRLGVTAVEEASVIIAVSSVHRKDSLAAVQYAIDALKATVPIWKLEVYEGDSRVWKENAEWGPGGGCCRTMVPIGGEDEDDDDGTEEQEDDDDEEEEEEEEEGEENLRKYGVDGGAGCGGGGGSGSGGGGGGNCCSGHGGANDFRS